MPRYAGKDIGVEPELDILNKALEKVLNVIALKGKELEGVSALYNDAKTKGDKLGKRLALLELEKIDHYQSLNEYFFEKVWAEWGRSLNNLEMLRQASIGGLDQEAMIASDPTNTFFINQGTLEGTEYSTTLISSKQIFLKKGYTKQAFFQNPQRFPAVLAQYCWMKQ